MGKKINGLLESFLSVFGKEKRGKVLDIGCGDGDYAYNLQKMGFSVLAADMDVARFKYADQIKFQKCNVAERLPFDDNSFDFIVLAEVIEHLKNPYDVVKELNRILKPGGKLVLSTPNILNLKSRMRFLIEGCWEYFREIPLEHSQNPKEIIWNLHLIPWRYHELEYLLRYNDLRIESIHTSKYEGRGLAFLVPLIKFQLKVKEMRANKKGGVNFARINRILLSKELLFGEHLIVKAAKTSEIQRKSSAHRA
ncbi:MAG: class I SAM-dependent methyltransferase [Candidatus Omnitrophica bacterium]|nr:class I SAM-dependent methyltransferase [Candidatus Omnitrophota bacterium]